MSLNEFYGNDMAFEPTDTFASSDATFKTKQQEEDELRISLLEEQIYALDQKSEQQKGRRMILMWLCVIAFFELLFIRFALENHYSMEEFLTGIIVIAVFASFYYWINFFLYMPIFTKAAEENKQLALYKQELKFLRSKK